MKHAATYKCLWFSEWLESMKDVQITFDILKGRFYTLRYEIWCQSIAKCNTIWKSCCVFHNRLLFVINLHENWDNNVSSDWEISNAKYEARIVGKFVSNWLNNPQYMNIERNSADGNKDCLNQYLVNGRRIVRKCQWIPAIIDWIFWY